MMNVFVRHKNKQDVLLMCDGAFNPLQEIPRDEKNEPRSKALYVNVPDGYMGVYASKEGPVLFVNHDKYLFSDKSWGISVQEGVTHNEARFSAPGKKDLQFKYEKVELDPLNPWSQKEFDDFFIWLSQKRDSQGFIDLWTADL